MARTTDRVTRSRSTTSGSGVIQIATHIDPKLIEQARLDLDDESGLWDGRESFRDTLRRFLLRYTNGGFLTQDEYNKTFNIVRYNDELRKKPRPGTTAPRPVPPPPEPESELRETTGQAD